MATDILCLLALLMLPLWLPCGTCQDNFTFADFNARSSNHIIFRGSAQLSDHGNFVDLTRTNTSARAQSVQDNSGRALYYRPLTMWPASFTTTFTVLIANITPYYPGQGLAFLVTPDAGEPPAGSSGSYLGLFNFSMINSNTTVQLAVELDTVQNQEYDPDNNHVGIDTVSIRSIVTASLTPHGIVLNSGRPVAIRVSYDGWSHTLAVYAAYADSGKPAYVSVLNYSIFLSEILPRACYVGFSAATNLVVETHRVLNWQFSSEILPESSLPRRQPFGLSTAQKAALVSVCTIGILALVSAAAMLMLLLRKKMQEERTNGAWTTALSVPYGPRRVTYKQLRAATGNFRDAHLLGKGGFGSVYRGILLLPDGANCATVAVKRIRQTPNGSSSEHILR